MGLNLLLYDFRHIDRDKPDYPHWDERFDSSRHREDYAFAEWLNDGNAIFKFIGPPEAFNRFRWFIRSWELTNEQLEQVMEREGGYGLHEAFEGLVLERPKDFVAARQWMQEYTDPYIGVWNCKRLWSLLDLLESDENIWLFESV